MKKFIKRAAALAALAAVGVSVPLMSGCTSDHPEAVITIEFNGATYELKYKMYRNMYPQTVQHFIELADAGFYNDTIIHDYASDYWYGGGYSYNGANYESTYEADFEDGESTMKAYFEANSKEKQYYDMFTAGRLTPSVYCDYLDGQYRDALPTLICEAGETHVIENGALTGSYGALRMFYSSKDLEKSDIIYLNKNGNDMPILAEYGQHSATSMFSIQVGSSTDADSKYCVFAQLTDTTPLSDLQSAITSYTSSHSNFTIKVEDVEIDLYDQIIGDRYTNVDDYVVTSMPLKIVSVKITKY